VRSQWLSVCVAVLDHMSTEPLLIVRPPTSRTALVGSDVLVECFASGFPQPTITWSTLESFTKGSSLQITCWVADCYV